ncbi:MAG: DUF4091 domain-containing protein [Clostridia bacterium]|nr:DUF4091 domain-containing protein [Clostridia bacterium]
MGRRILTIIIILCMLTACVTPGGCAVTEKTMWFEPPTKKVMRDGKPGRRDKYTVCMAGNEKEGLQAVLKYQYVTGPVTVRVEPPVDQNGRTLGVEVFEVRYVSTTYAEPFFTDEKLVGKSVDFPDGLAPLSDDLIIPSNEAKPFYILFDSTDAEAGDYRTEFTVSDKGAIIDRGEITVHVWSFSLPKTRSFEAVAGLGAYPINKVEKPDSDEAAQALYVKYYEFLLDHNICAYDLPYDILDERADRYMNDERVTNFRIPYSGDDGTIRAYYEKLSSNKEWLAKGYFYPLDEPGDPEAYIALRQAGERLSRLFPEYRMVSPFFVNPDMDATTDGIEYVSDVVNIWCPKLFCFDQENIYSEEQAASRTSFRERMKAFSERGDDLWWYVCWEPGEPYCNLYVNQPGVKNRSIFWQADVYGVNGFLYWSVNFWDQIINPWEDANTVKWLTPYVFGDGTLLYDGRHVSADGPCSSLRLEAVRDGIDDLELIRMARSIAAEQGKAHKVDAIVKKVAKSITDYSTDDNAIINARIALARIIEAYFR